jgi:hypothetical protein
MKSSIKLYIHRIGIALVVVFLLTSCISGKEHLKKKLDTLPNLKSTEIFTHSSEFSGATGRCKGTLLDTWYGTDLASEDILESYRNYFIKEGWAIWPDEVVEIWSLESSDGLYRIHIDAFTDPANIPQQQSSYTLPDSVSDELTRYKTVYLLNMTHMSSSNYKKCFDK